MLWTVASLKGFEVEAQDGRIGSVSDFLFDDADWRIHWLVVDTGHWLTGRKIVLPRIMLQPPDHDRHRLPVTLTVKQVEDGPDVDTEQPVSREIEANLAAYYSWVPATSVPISNNMAVAYTVPPPPTARQLRAITRLQAEPDAGGDPHLRSAATVSGYRVHASDGDLGHVEGFLVDDGDWSIRWLILATANWWPGELVLVAPTAVTAIDWSDGSISVDLDRDQIRAAPKYAANVTL